MRQVMYSRHSSFLKRSIFKIRGLKVSQMELDSGRAQAVGSLRYRFPYGFHVGFTTPEETNRHKISHRRQIINICQRGCHQCVQQNSIKFSLPINSTNILQPLGSAPYRPMKIPTRDTTSLKKTRWKEVSNRAERSIILRL